MKNNFNLAQIQYLLGLLVSVANYCKQAINYKLFKSSKLIFRQQADVQKFNHEAMKRETTLFRQVQNIHTQKIIWTNVFEEISEFYRR
jgi:hypothetical protein